MRTGILLMVTGLVLSACGGQPAFYASHSYACCPEILANTTWHAGEKVVLHWQSTPAAMSTDANPRKIVLTVILTGPYGSVDVLKEATSQGVKPAGVRTVNAAQISVDDRTFSSPMSQLPLPADLPPGYYNLATSAAGSGQSAGASAVVSIVLGP